MKLKPKIESPKIESEDGIIPEYDFSAVRGKYYERYRQGTNGNGLRRQLGDLL